MSTGHIIKPHETYGVPPEFSSPAASLEVPRQASIEFNSPSSSYGPPASGNPQDSHEFASSSRSNIVVEAEKQNIEAAGSESTSFVSGQDLPKHAALEGLDVISTQKSESLSIPVEGKFGNYQLQFQSANGENNAIDSPNHQQFLTDGLLQSIITAIEQKPSQTVPQVTEEDQESDHSEVQIFLKSPDGQEVLSDEKKEESAR